MKKILLIENDKECSDSIKEYLSLENNFSIVQSFDGEDGLNKALSEKYDLILLDLIIPKIDGIIIIKKLSKKINIPIIIITTIDLLDKKLEGFEAGAIDYIVKPFNLKELEARIKAHLQLNKSNIIDCEKLNIYIDLDKIEFYKENKQVKITTKEYLIFKYLCQNKNRISTRTDLIEYVWGNENLFENDSKLDVYISNLRKKLNKNMIETVKGIGYKLSKF